MASMLVVGVRTASSVTARLQGSISGAIRKISGDQIIGAPAAADVHLCGGRTYHITIEIKRGQEARFIAASIRFESLQRVFLYEK